MQRSEPKNMLAQLRTFQIANADLRERLALQEKSFEEMKIRLAQEVVEEEINQLKMLSGEQDVFGPGIEITFSSPMKSFWITDLVAELVNAGAQAVSINDLRLTERTAGFRDVGGGLVMRRFFLRAPFKISAIGPSNELNQAVSQSGGILDRIKKSTPGMTINYVRKDEVWMPALPVEN